MAFFEWNDKLSVNIASIDKQHMKLVDMLNDLYENMTKESGEEVLGKILHEMVAYTIEHFNTEEHYMTRHNFPGLEEHKKEHAAFSAKAHELLDRYKENPFSLKAETGRFLKEWLHHHIGVVDKAYGPFLNDKGIF
jgi:hemerythrin-like metal-binding protein